jgi:Lon protease-like protein
MYNGTMNTLLPLFPLNTVLFPGQLLPLHIFEARYRQMIGECIQTGTPFGVVLIREGEEVGESAEPYDVGTTAHIVQVERLDDGRLDIVCVGHARFRIQQTYHDRSYLRGNIELWPWTPFDQSLPQLHVDQVRQRLDRYIKILAEITHSDVQVELPDDPAALANMAAAVLQVDAAEKQQLLTTNSIGDLLDQIGVLLQHELRGLQIMYSTPHKPPEDSTPFSSN